MHNELPERFPDVVIFDWDNTLVDTWGVITDALNAARTRFGLCAWSIEDAQTHSARALRVSFPEWFGDQWEEARDIFYAQVDKMHLQLIKPMPGAQELLDWFAEQQVPLALVSTKKGDLLRKEIEHMGWAGFFAIVAGSFDAPKDKPDPAPVWLVLERLNVKNDNQNVWFVGDSHADVECALRARCLPVLITSEEKAQKFGIRSYFSGCQDMKTALNKWKFMQQD